MGREILVVKRDLLFKEGDFQGFLDFNEKDYLSDVLKNFEFRERGDELENDENYLQIIPYVWLLNPETRKVFLYKRAPSKGEYKEERHLDRYSGGVGGHIDRDTEEKAVDPIGAAMMRELKEEVVMSKYPKPKFIGYINDDSDIYNKVHFGVVGMAETREEVGAADGMAHGKFYSVEEVDNLILNKNVDVEKWTMVSWPFVKDYLNKL